MYLNRSPESNILRTNCKCYKNILVQMFDWNKTTTTTTITTCKQCFKGDYGEYIVKADPNTDVVKLYMFFPH